MMNTKNKIIRWLAHEGWISGHLRKRKGTLRSDRRGVGFVFLEILAILGIIALLWNIFITPYQTVLDTGMGMVPVADRPTAQPTANIFVLAFAYWPDFTLICMVVYGLVSAIRRNPGE